MESLAALHLGFGKRTCRSAVVARSCTVVMRDFIFDEPPSAPWSLLPRLPWGVSGGEALGLAVLPCGALPPVVCCSSALFRLGWPARDLGRVAALAQDPPLVAVVLW